MENASKALIIAGAILISILLISVGIIIMNAINNPVQQGGKAADSQAIEMFNSKYTSYAGTQKGSTLKGLDSIVRAANNADESHHVIVTYSAKSGETAPSSLSALTSTQDYTVKIRYYNGSASTETDSEGKSLTSSATSLVGGTTVVSENAYIYEINISKK